MRARHKEKLSYNDLKSIWIDASNLRESESLDTDSIGDENTFWTPSQINDGDEAEDDKFSCSEMDIEDEMVVCLNSEAVICDILG